MAEQLEQGAVIVLDEIVRRAVRAHASDIHLEPKRDRMNVRFRVDGEMVEEQSVPLDISSEVVSRIKVLARMDIAERRVPQDGQLTLSPEGNQVHLRASSFPASLGEKIVMRILSGQALIPFEKLGLDAVTQAIVRELVDRPQGFLVTSGPTGAGKTSTLYSFMRLIDTRRTNVMTLEDPIEVELPQLTQGQTNIKAGFTFATGLRAILRQDPDVIMVGEIRDKETAGIALQASLTGHLVLSTVHTSDAVETAVRLVDLGVEPWIVANALTGILAQRLVRLVCKNCQEETALDADLLDGEDVILAKGSRVVKPKGCQECLRTGY
jgi:general secretion pathway protein E/type IV pilus assembly protein PilB